MQKPKKYVLTIEYDKDTDICKSVTEELITDDLILMVDDLNMAEYYDEEALELCKDVYDIGIA